MYYVGIDISKFKHDCAVIDGNSGEIIRSSWSFNNDSDGFLTLKLLLDELEGEKRIGFESTGHYGLNLKLFLESNDFTFMEFNPILIRNFVSGKTLRRTKTDSLDAISIAQYLMTVEYKPYPSSFYHLSELKSLTRFREDLVDQRSRHLVSLTNVMDEVFPEFKPFFGDQFGTTAMYILANYGTPAKISRLQNKSYETLRSVSNGKFGFARFIELKQLAKQTVGHTTACLEEQLRTLLDQIAYLNSKIEKIEATIERETRVLESPILSIPGVGILTTAVVLAEFGDFSRFSTPGKMLAFAGLESGYSQSGVSESHGKMVKHGSPHLRRAVLNCCLPLVKCNPLFREYYEKKRAEGKPHRVALTHVAKKLIRIMFTLQTTNTRFDYSLAK